MESAFFRKKWITSFIVLVIAVFLLGGCSLAKHPPIIRSLKAEPEAVSPSGLCHIECIASDYDGDELSYEWSASKGDINGNGAAINWSAPDSEGIYNITVKVSDGNDGEATNSTTINVRVNHPPTVTGLIADMDWVHPSSSCRIECNAEDPDGDELNYEWSAGEGDISGTGSVITWTASEALGLRSIMVVVTDGYGGEVTRSLTISVAAKPPPVIKDLVVTAKEPKYLKEYSGYYKVMKGKSYAIECVAEASDGLVYVWACDGGEISGEGPVVTWTAPDKGAEVTITVAVSDAVGNTATKNVVFKVMTCACGFN